MRMDSFMVKIILLCICLFLTTNVYAQSRYFDGDDNINCGDVGIDTLTDFTVCGWFKTSNDFTGTAFILYEGFLQFYWNAADQLILFIRFVGDIDVSITSTFDPNDNLWHFFTITKDHVAGCKFYIDGILQGSDATTGTIKTLASNTRLGSDNDPKSYFVGIIDEVVVTNRAFDLQDIETAMSIRPPNENDTIEMNLPMDELDGTVFDRSGNGHDGFATGTTVDDQAPIKIIIGE